MNFGICRRKVIGTRILLNAVLGVFLALLYVAGPANAQTFRDMLRQIERTLEGDKPERREPPPPQPYIAPYTNDWTATSTAASGVTGDLSIQDNRIVFSNGASIAISPVGPDRPEIYRVDPPANPQLRNGNRLCGVNAPTFVVLGRNENSLDLAQSDSLYLKIYDGSEIPPASASVGPTPNGQGLCAVLNYERDFSSTSPRRNVTWQAQKLLNALNYDAGPEDGAMGPRTRSALSAFQNDQNLPATGSPNAETLAALNHRAADGQAAVARSTQSAGTTGSDDQGARSVVADPGPDDSHVDLSGYALVDKDGEPHPQGSDLNRRLALHAVNLAPDLLNERGVALRWFDMDHRAGARPSALRLKYNAANATGREEILRDFAAGIANEAQSPSIRSQRTYKVAIVFEARTGAYTDGRLALVPAPTFRAIQPAARTVHLRPSLFLFDFWAQLIDLPDITSISVDAVQERSIRRSLAKGRQEIGIGVVRMTVTIPEEGTIERRGSIPWPTIRASATLDGVSLHTHQIRDGQLAPGELVHLWKRGSQVAAGRSDFESFARTHGIPIIGGLPAILHRSTIGYFEDIARDRAGHSKTAESWAKALDLLTVGEAPGTLDNIQSVVYWTDRRLSPAERVQLVGIGKTAGSLDEFQKRKLAADFKEQFQERVVASAPKFPFDLVEIRRVSLGQYDFSDESFPLSFEEARAIHLPQSNTGGPPAAPLNVTGFPKRLKIPATDAEALSNSLKRGRSAYLALYARAKAMTFARGNPAPGTAISALIASRRLDVELSEMKLFGDARLTQEIASFDVSEFLPVERRRDPLAARLSQITITSAERLIPLVSELTGNPDFIGALVKEGRLYKEATEFDRDSVLDQEAARLLGSIERQPLWLRGTMQLGQYDLSSKTFEIRGFNLEAHESSSYYRNSVDFRVADTTGWRRLAVPPDTAEAAVKRAGNARTFYVATRAKPVGAELVGQAGRPRGRLFLDLEEIYVYHRARPGDDPFLVAHVIPTPAAAVSGPMRGAPSPTVPSRVEIGPDVIDLLILGQDPSRFDSAMIDRVFYDRWLYERSTDSPAWGRFFTIASPPNRVEFERMLPAFKTWTRARIDALPKQLIVNWNHMDNSWNFDGCRGYLTAVQQKGNYRNALDGLVDFSKSDPVFQARQRMMRAEGPNEAGPLYFPLEGRPAADCSKRRLDGLTQKFDSESVATSLVVVENAVMPSGKEFTNLGRSELEVELDRLEIVRDGTTPTIRLFATAVSSRHFAKDNRQVAVLTEADLPKPETKPDRPPAAAGPDILGVKLGMSIKEAEALIRKNFTVGRVMVASRDWQPEAAVGKPGTYTSGRLYVSADESDMIMLFDEPPAAPGIVMGVLRQIALPKGQVPAAALINQLRQRYGREASTARGQLIWSETGQVGNERCIPAENAAQSMTIWRDEKGQIDDKWRPKGMRYSGMSPSLRRDSSPQERCSRLLTALIDIQSNSDWDRLEVRLFDHETYSTFHARSVEMLKAAPAAGAAPANVPVIKF